MEMMKMMELAMAMMEKMEQMEQMCENEDSCLPERQSAPAPAPMPELDMERVRASAKVFMPLVGNDVYGYFSRYDYTENMTEKCYSLDELIQLGIVLDEGEKHRIYRVNPAYMADSVLDRNYLMAMEQVIRNHGEMVVVS